MPKIKNRTVKLHYSQIEDCLVAYLAALGEIKEWEDVIELGMSLNPDKDGLVPIRLVIKHE